MEYILKNWFPPKLGGSEGVFCRPRVGQGFGWTVQRGRLSARDSMPAGQSCLQALDS